MKLYALLFLALCYFRSGYVEAQETLTTASIPLAPTPGPGSGDGGDNDTTASEDVTEEPTQEVDMVTTASNVTDLPNTGLADGELAGIVVGVVAFIVLLGLLTSILVILSIKSTIKAKIVSVKPTKTTVSEAKPTNSKVTSHDSSTVKEDLPLVDQ